MTGPYDASCLRSRLESSIAGTVDASPHHTRYYSVDASAYIIRPDVVVAPNDIHDVISAIAIAKEMDAPITPRGGGTGLVGGALNCGIILDMKAMDEVRITGDSTVAVGGGAPRGKVDRILRADGRMFAPNPSVGPFCTIGGMIANNAAGSRSLRYGCTIDNVTAITIVDGTGRAVRLPDDPDRGGRILEIAGGIDRDRFPKVSKNSSGYRLDAVASMRDTHKALVGSEGTLGIIVSAELSTVKLPPSRRLYILEYDSVTDAAADCTHITGMTDPAAVEFVDKTILENMDYEFRKDTACLLAVEYHGNGHDAQSDLPDSGDATLHGASCPSATASVASVACNATNSICITDESGMNGWQRYRDASLHYSLMSVREGAEEHIPHVIEDAAVPISRLPALFAALRSINDKYDARTIMYGHAGDGNIHVRLVTQKGGIKHLRRIASEYFEKITAACGSITGEHGDGLARSEFVATQYGPKNMAQFEKLKRLFDPSSIMNPGKILTDKTGILTQNLWNFVPPKI